MCMDPKTQADNFWHSHCTGLGRLVTAKLKKVKPGIYDNGFCFSKVKNLVFFDDPCS